MYSNFAKIEQFEHEILHHSQQLENRLSDLTLKETQIQASEIRLHFFMSLTNQKSASMAQLRMIKIEIPSKIRIVQALLRNTKYCEEITCYSDAMFSYNIS